MQYECPRQVELMGFWQTSPADWNLQFLQQALFLSLDTEMQLMYPNPTLWYFGPDGHPSLTCTEPRPSAGSRGYSSGRS